MGVQGVNPCGVTYRSRATIVELPYTGGTKVHR